MALLEDVVSLLVVFATPALVSWFRANAQCQGPVRRAVTKASCTKLKKKLEVAKVCSL